MSSNKILRGRWSYVLALNLWIRFYYMMRFILENIFISCSSCDFVRCRIRGAHHTFHHKSSTITSKIIHRDKKQASTYEFSSIDKWILRVRYIAILVDLEPGTPETSPARDRPAEEQPSTPVRPATPENENRIG